MENMDLKQWGLIFGAFVAGGLLGYGICYLKENSDEKKKKEKSEQKKP